MTPNNLLDPKKAVAAAGVGLGVWLVCGALAEVAERVRAGKVPAAESLRRLGGLPRGAWGMTLAHLGLGVFVLGACVETAWKVEAAEVLTPGGSLEAGAYVLRLESVGGAYGPNYLAERARISATRGGDAVCTLEPERRFYPAGGQTTTEVGLCFIGLSDLYVALGEPRQGAGTDPARLVRAYWNPWARLIFLGPAIMALGGLVSLSDRRLRMGAPGKAGGRVAEAGS